MIHALSHPSQTCDKAKVYKADKISQHASRNCTTLSRAASPMHAHGKGTRHSDHEHWKTGKQETLAELKACFALQTNGLTHGGKCLNTRAPAACCLNRLLLGEDHHA